jgi:CHASE2 domain-containing sensor protein
MIVPSLLHIQRYSNLFKKLIVLGKYLTASLNLQAYVVNQVRMAALLKQEGLKVWFMVFNATSNNISAMLWWIGLLVEETGIPRKNHRPVTSVSQKLIVLGKYLTASLNLQAYVVNQVRMAALLKQEGLS